MKKTGILSLCCCVLLSYLLGVSGGNVALFEADDPTPVHIFPYAVSDFPVRQQKALKEGIPISDAGELVKVLREYLS